MAENYIYADDFNQLLNRANTLANIYNVSNTFGASSVTSGTIITASDYNNLLNYISSISDTVDADIIPKYLSLSNTPGDESRILSFSFNDEKYSTSTYTLSYSTDYSNDNPNWISLASNVKSKSVTITSNTNGNKIYAINIYINGKNYKLEDTYNLSQLEAPTNNGWNRVSGSSTTYSTTYNTPSLGTLSLSSTNNGNISGNTVTVSSLGTTTVSAKISNTGYLSNSNTSSITLYQVRFFNDGTQLDLQYVISGESCTYSGTTPTREGYTFAWWSPSVSNVTKDIDTNAQYNINYYTIRFLDYDGTILSNKSLNYGAPITIPSNYTESYSNNYYDYTFSNWSPSVPSNVPAYENKTGQDYQASYSKVGKTISVSNDTTGGMATTTYISQGYWDDNTDSWVDTSYYEVSAKDTIFGYSTSAPMKITLTFNIHYLTAYKTFEWRGIFLNAYVSNDGINYTEYGQIGNDGGSGTDKLYFSGSSTISGYCYVKVSFNINNSSYGILAAPSELINTLTASITFV